VRDPDGTLRLTGELDLVSAEALGAELLAAVDAAMPGRLDLDLSAVSYLASAGVGLLLEGLRRARAAGGRLHVHADGSGPAARVLELAGVDTALDSAD
jgi:anti-anti-sigma factor